MVFHSRTRSQCPRNGPSVISRSRMSTFTISSECKALCAFHRRAVVRSEWPHPTCTTHDSRRSPNTRPSSADVLARSCRNRNALLAWPSRPAMIPIPTKRPAITRALIRKRTLSYSPYRRDNGELC